MKYKNTLQKGSVRFLVFREGKTWYGAALEFNITEEGDSAEEVSILLSQAIYGYLVSARKARARPHILNQKCDEEYERLWGLTQQKEKRIPFNVWTAGTYFFPTKGRSLIST